MLSGIGMVNSARNLVSAYRSNESFLNNAAQRIASGKSINNPSDNISDYFRSQKLTYENRHYDTLQRNVGDAMSLAKAAEGAGSEIYQKFNDLVHWVNSYWDPMSTNEERQAYQTQFNAAIDDIERVMTNTQYDGKNLLSDNGGNPFRQVMVDSVFTGTTINISFNASDIVDPTALRAIDITAPDQATVLSAVESEQSKAGIYLGKAIGYLNSLKSTYSLIDQKMQRNSQFNDVINNTNDAEEMMKFSKRSIQQQATTAMMAQSNMAYMSILSLFQNQ
jgi:flagellin